MGVGMDARGVEKTREDGLEWRVAAPVCGRFGWEDGLHSVFLMKWEGGGWWSGTLLRID